MWKVLVIAEREYRAMIGTKSFMISILMMPILMFGGLVAHQLLNKVGEIKERKIVVFDATNQLFEPLKQTAQKHNENLRGPIQRDTVDQGAPGMSKGDVFELTLGTGPLDNEQRLAQSDAIRAGEIYGFVEIPADIGNGTSMVKLYSQDSSIADARGWLGRELNLLVRNQKLTTFLNAEQTANVQQLLERVIPVAGMGLVERNSSGEIVDGKVKSEAADIFLPMGLMMLMFMVILMAAQPMLESVLEEKGQRIAEVLLGSVSSFQLMLGKLIGTVSGSLTIFLIYFAGSYFLAQQRGWTENIPLHLLPWFISFQVLGVLFYASIFMAVGASVSQLKEAQSMLIPVWTIMMLPIFVWWIIIRDPLGPLARWMSFFPPVAPSTMVLRLATNQPIPLWELIVSLLGLVLATLAVIVIAGRIFRVGILWQGKVPKLKELWQWAFSG